ncbi:MAG: transketolase [Actinomycetota bacterium]|nr:transketolase [Actinomycetota bacterium]
MRVRAAEGPLIKGEKVLRPFRSGFVDYAARHEEVVCLSADLTSSCEADGFREAFPDRFYSMGMTEQSMMGVAGGLAREGLVPFVTTFSVFVTRRPYDQVAMAIAYPDLPVRLIGFLPGITTPGGVTHQAIDDVNLMRGLPNMTVIDLGDASEVESVWRAFDAVEGPVFCRMLRGEVPRLFGSPMTFGRARLLSEGGDVAVVSSGFATYLTRAAVPFLESQGLRVSQLHVSTLKPFDDPLVLDTLRAVRHVVTVENHSTIGGLGSAVCEMLAEAGAGVPVTRLGVADRFTHGGSTKYLASYYGLDAYAVVRAVSEGAGRPIVASEAELRGELDALSADLDGAPGENAPTGPGEPTGPGGPTGPVGPVQANVEAL